MKWTIEYFNRKLEEAILKLPDGLLARYLRLADLMLEFGPNLGMPHTKAIQKANSRTNYQNTMLKLSIPSAQIQLANNFYDSLIKNRIGSCCCNLMISTKLIFSNTAKIVFLILKGLNLLL